MINPYDLLGLTIESTPEDARAAFRDLALIVHPDKGGRAAEFKVLLDAYRYVTDQLTAINRTETVESLEAAFEAFCVAQKDQQPCLRELLRSIGDSKEVAAGDGASFDVDRFNACFEDAMANAASSTLPTSASAEVEAGYGGWMDESEYGSASNTKKPVEPTEYKPLQVDDSRPFLPGIQRPPPPPQQQRRQPDDSASSSSTSSSPSPFDRQVILHTTPMTGDSSRSFFSSGVGGADYAVAYSRTQEPLAEIPSTLLDTSVDALLEIAKAAREQQEIDMRSTLDQSLKMRVESDIMALRQRISGTAPEAYFPRA